MESEPIEPMISKGNSETFRIIRTGGFEIKDLPTPAFFMIVASIFIAIISGIYLYIDETPYFAFIGFGIASFLYLPGIIRWAVSGSTLYQLSQLQKQNLQIIDLLEILSSRTNTKEDLELLRNLYESGKIDTAEYRKQKRDILIEKS